MLNACDFFKCSPEAMAIICTCLIAPLVVDSLGTKSCIFHHNLGVYIPLSTKITNFTSVLTLCIYKTQCVISFVRIFFDDCTNKEFARIVKRDFFFFARTTDAHLYLT